jgi:LAO/AO transport system kinase
VPTTATTGEGVPDLWDAIRRHREHLIASGELEERRARRVRDELQRIVVERLHERARVAMDGDRLEAVEERVLARELDPWAAADELLAGA